MGECVECLYTLAILLTEKEAGLPRTNLGGDDPYHSQSDEEKDKHEARLRAEAKQHLLDREPKEARRKLARAVNISRRPSRRAHGNDKRR